MFEKIAIRYLIKLLKRTRINDLELVIRSNGYTWRKRDFEKEKSIADTLCLIK